MVDGMDTPLHVVIVGGTEARADALRDELRRHGYVPNGPRVEDEDGLRNALTLGPVDLVLSDDAVAGLSPLRVLSVLEEHEWDGPTIVLSDELDESLVVAALHAGAGDFLTWGRLGRLGPAVGRELRAAQGRRRREDVERTRREADDRYRALIEEIPALTYISWADPFGSPVYVSPQIKAMTGYTPAEWLADRESWVRSIHPEDRERVLAELKRCRDEGRPFSCEYRTVTREGRTTWWRDDGRFLKDGEGRPQFLRGLIVDVTERKQADETIRRLMYYDALTGLPNRALLLERLQQELAQSRTQGRPLALLLLDLDHFRQVNNTLGSENGDRVIQEVARRLSDAVGGADQVARLRGDEFALLLPGGDATLGRQVAARLLKALAQPVMIHRLPVEVGASIGIAVAPDHGEEGETLLRRVDLAMQAGKRAGESPVVYSSDCDPYDPHRVVVLGELRRAIESDHLVLHYQPKVDLRNGSVLGSEALVRWRHPKQGLLYPDRFIGLAEQGGLIKALTGWVLDRAVADCRAWEQQGRTLSVAVNLSARNLQDPQLADRIAQLIEARGLPPARLELELTESAVLADPRRAAETLEQLNQSGIALAIDDFGTGYSSLAYLRKLPVSQLKIDKSFVMAMARNPEDSMIVRSTSDLGHNLGLKVVAEGVEDKSTWDMLSQFGCDAAQGYYMARPMPAADLSVWLQGH
jgi:diguanylate cyclase (GGDEF)-like protein/PAS domain S-box-containing protein